MTDTTAELPKLIAEVVNKPVFESTIIRSDTYPANVEFSFATHDYPRARAIVTMNEVLVMVEGATGIMDLYRRRLLDVTGNHKRIIATTEDGTITITKQSGCGCGSSLKSHRAFRDQQRMAFR